jgi:hypothetical protein
MVVVEAPFKLSALKAFPRRHFVALIKKVVPMTRRYVESVTTIRRVSATVVIATPVGWNEVNVVTLVLGKGAIDNILICHIPHFIGNDVR